MTTVKQCDRCGVMIDENGFVKIYKREFVKICKEWTYSNKPYEYYESYGEQQYYNLCKDCAKEFDLFINKNADKKVIV